MYHETLQKVNTVSLFIVPPVCSAQATDGDAGTFGTVRYYFSDEPDQ